MTAYLSQSFLFAVIFMALPALTGIGLHLGEARAAGIALAVWLVTVGLCAALERGGHAGPFETLLRTAVARASAYAGCRPVRPRPHRWVPPAPTTRRAEAPKHGWVPQAMGKASPVARRVRAATSSRDFVWWGGPATALMARHRSMS